MVPDLEEYDLLSAVGIEKFKRQCSCLRIFSLGTMADWELGAYNATKEGPE